MADKKGNKKDERALDALLTAAFRVNFPEDISDEEADRFFQEPTQLSREDRDAINSWGTDFIKKLIKGQKTISDEQQCENIIDDALEMEICAMARDQNGNDVSDETRRIIEEERNKTLDDEDKKDAEQGSESGS